MRIIDTGITKEILTGDNHPQLKIGNELFTVDDRQSTWEKIQEVQKREDLNENEKTNLIYELALGKEDADKLKSMDLPVSSAIYLSYCIMGAIIGEEPKKLMEDSRKN